MGHDRTLVPVPGPAILALVALLLVPVCRQADPPADTERLGSPASVPSGFVDAQVASGLSGPTSMTFAPDGRLFVCEQGGRLRVIKNGSLLSTPFLTVSVSSSGERGLLGVAFDPGFATNHFLYIYYTTSSSPIHNRVARYTANGDVAVAGSAMTLLDLPSLSSATNHNGGAMHFGNDGKLYIAVGENANGSNAQSMTTVLGKMLRINGDGTIPSDNPFFGSTSGMNRAIWALGLRNPFTFEFRRSNGRMFINDVGNATWEEIDEGMAGANYGWPTTEGDTSDPRFKAPFYFYRNDRSTVCAIAGGTFYDPTAVQFPSSYVGQYFFADYCGNFIKKIDPANKAVTTFATGINGPVDLDVGPDGQLYYLAHGSGTVGRIRSSATGQAPSFTEQPASVTRGIGQTATFTVAATGTQPLSYQWQRGTTNISGATSASYTTEALDTADNGAQFRVVVTNSIGSATSNSATLTVLNDHPPTPSIDVPVSGSFYRAGDTISYSGSATDQEDPSFSPGQFSWKIDFHHDTHTHPFLLETPGATGGTFTVPRDGETSTNVWFRIYLTVTDSAGLTTRVARDIHPRTANLALQTDPPGLSLTVDGSPVSTPLTVPAVVGMNRALGAPSPQIVGGITYAFDSWSDGGAATHDITVPGTDTTYRAVFTGPQPFKEDSGQVVMEAENFTGAAPGTGTATNSNWALQSLTGASGGVLTALPNAGVNTAETTIGPRRDYAIRFTNTGTYQVWVRLRGPAGADDSVHVGLAGTNLTTGAQGLNNGATLGWKNVVGTRRITLNVASPGVMALNLWMREDGVQVDRLLLTKDAAFTPSGTGPAESPRDGSPPPPPPDAAPPPDASPPPQDAGTPPPPSLSNLVVNDNLPAGCVSPSCNKDKWSIQSSFAVGVQPFGDRTYTIDSIGNSTLTGRPWVRTAADSKNYTGSPLATVSVTGSFVYLIVDNRHNGTGTKPAWLDSSWADQGYDVVVRQSSTATFPYSVWRKAITSGDTIALPRIGSSVAPCYFVVVQ
jgi:glucose/arabinose dehydrogenase